MENSRIRNNAQVSIIIPTYNESKNIIQILKSIGEHLPKNLLAEAIVVDDNSPDGTQKEIKNFMLKNNKIKLLTRKNKKGVGSAHKLGIKWGYKKKYLKIITMDCDGTHDPFYIKKILRLSISKGGSSIKDYRNILGKSGSFQQFFSVYGQENKNCSRISCKGKIKKIKISNRSSFYCNVCQN